jgi:hypothetical protein
MGYLSHKMDLHNYQEWIAERQRLIERIKELEAENAVVKKAAQALADWTHSTASIFSRDDERIIGQGIIAQCQLNGLNPCQESDRMKAANCIADKADSIVGCIGRFQWDIAVTRIGQLASEMRLLTGGQSVGGSNGNADELTNWNGTKKRGLGI